MSPASALSGRLTDFIVAGALREDCVWENEIWLQGDVLVPEGVTLSIVPGTVIQCAQAAEKLLQAERPPQGRWGLSHSNVLRNIIVRGRIAAHGEADRPIQFGANKAWAGIHLKGSGSGSFSHAIFSASAAEAVAAWEASTLQARHVSCANNWASFGAYDRSRADLSDCQMEQNIRYGMLCASDATIKAEHCKIIGGHGGAAADGGRILLSNLLFQNQAAFGVAVVWKHRVGVWTGAASHADLTACSVEGGKSGVIAEGGSLRMQDCLLTHQSGHGLRVDGGRVEARALELAGQRDAGVYITGDSIVRLIGFSVRNAPIGIAASSGRICLENYRSTKCRYPLSIEPDAELLIDPGFKYWQWNWRWLLLRFVLRTRSHPFLRRLYRYLYESAVGRLSAWARRDAQVDAAWVHRGWSGGDWEPGISDLDFVLSVRNLKGDGGAHWLKRFWRRYDLSRILFPFKGETLIAEPAEHELYLRRGGIRAAETLRHTVMLKGQLPEDPSPKNREKPFNVLWEVAHSYTQFMVWWIYRTGLPWEVRRRHLFKAALDFLRYSALPADSLSSSLFLSRSEFWTDIEQTPFAHWKQRLSLLLSSVNPDRSRSDQLAAELCLACLPVLDGLARKALSAAASNGPIQTRQWNFARPYQGDEAAGVSARLKFLERSQRWLDGAMSAALLNDLYCSYVVLEDGALEGGLDAEDLAGWAQLWRGDPAARNAPLLMTRGIWRAWQRLGYQENPLRFLELGAPASRDYDLFSAGEFLPGCFSFRWRLNCDIPEGADGLLREQAMDSLACLRLQWRLMGCDAAQVSTGYMLHYLYSRILGLRLLLERDIPMPFFALDQILAAYRDEFPHTYRDINRLERGIAEKSRKAAFREHYGFLDSQLRAIKAARHYLLSC